MDSYKIFKQLEEREKRTNPYKFYDKDELIDEILKLEDKIEEVREYITEHLYMESTAGIQHPRFDGKLDRDTNGFEILEILDKENIE